MSLRKTRLHLVWGKSQAGSEWYPHQIKPTSWTLAHLAVAQTHWSPGVGAVTKSWSWQVYEIWSGCMSWKEAIASKTPKHFSSPCPATNAYAPMPTYTFQSSMHIAPGNHILRMGIFFPRLTALDDSCFLIWLGWWIAAWLGGPASSQSKARRMNSSWQGTWHLMNGLSTPKSQPDTKGPSHQPQR